MLDTPLVSHVGADEEGSVSAHLARNGLGGSLASGLIQLGNDHPRAKPGPSARGFEPDAAARAGDHRNLARE